MLASERANAINLNVASLVECTQATRLESEVLPHPFAITQLSPPGTLFPSIGAPRAHARLSVRDFSSRGTIDRTRAAKE